MRIVTYNLRYDYKPDNISVGESLSTLPDPLVQPTFLGVRNEQPWSTRRIRIAQHLLSETIQVACFQEALIRQVRDLAELFGPDWEWVGVGRDDGAEKGEFNPIFYNRSALRLISSDTFWLSETPFRPSKYSDAGCFRICTVTHFSVISSGKRLTLLNTHLDHQSDNQRRLAASLLLTRARYEAVATGGPVFITGDFNSTSSGRDSGAYDIVTGALPPVTVDQAFENKYRVPEHHLPGFCMVDLRAATPRWNVSGNFATFTNFSAAADTKSWSRIDFIFGGSNLGWTATRYNVASVLSDDGVLSSDHRPVFADVSL
ncbi:hypothetical protein AX17_006055 [Amanita inopinata Kibby_2008]|nr:hypothetical protein AX17_006055 [Amanita inopinata Kibby_2008]